MDVRKKVLLVNDFEKGGGAEGVFQMTADLLSSSCDVFRYTAYKGFDDSGSNPLSYIYSKKHFRNIRDIVVKEDINIVHVHNFRWISPSVFQVHKWLKRHHHKSVKFILTAHDYLLACPNVAYGYYDKKNGFVKYPTDALPGSFLFKQMDQNGLKFSMLKKIQWYLAFKIFKLQNEIDQVITPSIFLKNILQLNCPKLPIEVIRNPISPEVLKIPMNMPQRKRLEGNFRLIYLGRVASEKGTDLLLKMLSELIDTIDFQLDIFGTGPLSEGIKLLIQNLGLNNHVSYKGFVSFEEIKTNFVNYDAFVMSSIWYENAPLSIVEAAINRLALITPNIGGMKELAELCGNAFLYELGDTRSLKKAINQAISSLNIEIENNTLKIRNIFSQETYINLLNECYS
ncbi:glycosyltransferase family 4 protein [Rhizosphaericola mali]|uniref:Glycosyltransferase family 4 protein n=1 Tax=Rhizosphaericola mali TaxID=2545455 RepID=A0A5P2G1Y9_9BACT|nr:glycosyltransferase family 4 protein [Rhizosphaericola mali]QES89187.1 glycosyltransferase family 4 protein [Rhizosphaericola mali]